MNSTCASQVLDTLGATNASPMSDGLRFEDFVNPKFAKDWLPTIGIRTSEEGRTFIINYLADKYGIEHVAVVARDDASDRTIRTRRSASSSNLTSSMPTSASGPTTSIPPKRSPEERQLKFEIGPLLDNHHQAALGADAERLAVRRKARAPAVGQSDDFRHMTRRQRKVTNQADEYLSGLTSVSRPSR